MTLNEFENELLKLNIKLDDIQKEQLERYYSFLIEYNKVMNLTGITEKSQVYLKHFYDSITLVKTINLNTYETLCDIGTGAGFPGLVLKIVFPNLKITLIDSLNKRIEFLKFVINELELKDIEAIHARCEEYGIKNREIFDIATARAVAPLNILIEYSIPMLKVNGYFIPMKANISQEIIESKNALEKLDCEIISQVEFELPKEQSKRTLIKIRKNKQTKKLFPRKYSEIKKRPL